MPLDLLVYLSLLSVAFATFHPNRFLVQPPVTPTYDYETRYFVTLRDHFSFLDDETFKLKYLISVKHHVPNGPVLFYTGNEGDIETFAENSGFLWETAQELSAAVVFAEHRYYGTSLPFVNDSLKDPAHFGYLTAEQAMADFARLINHLRTTEVNFSKSSFFAIGGSYGGILAAWMRLKYPNLITGALASSAPMWMFPNMSDCHGFARVNTDAFEKTGGVTCTQNIGAVWNALQEVAKGPSGNQILSMIFMLCDPLMEVQNLVDYLVDFFGTVAMVNYPYNASFLGNFPGHPVKYMCKDLSVFTTEDLPLEVVRRVSAAVRRLTNYTGAQKCIDLSETSPGLDINGWDIQTCMEMTVPMCSDGKNDMFPPNEWDADAFSSQCFKKHGVRPRMNWANLQFWGRNLDTATNIIFTNGDLDPWSAYGVLDPQLVPSSHVIRIPNGAHHLDLRAQNVDDPADVLDARKQIVKLFKSWLNIV